MIAIIKNNPPITLPTMIPMSSQSSSVHDEPDPEDDLTEEREPEEDRTMERDYNGQSLPLELLRPLTISRKSVKAQSKHHTATIVCDKSIE